VLLFLGWYGVSGRATIGEQMPYLASGSIPGAALVIAGAVLFASDVTRDSNERAEAAVAQLHALLTEAVADDGLPSVEAAPAPDPGLSLVTTDGVRVHRATCALVAGRDVRPIAAGSDGSSALERCPVCEP